MLFAVIKKNSYQDSINLMLLTKQLSGMDKVRKVSVMMGTPANLDILKNSGLYTPDLEEATPSDICIVVDSDTGETVIDLLVEDEETDIIIFISKPPAPEVRKQVVEKLSGQSKPVVAIFMGEDLPSEGHIQYAWTLDETARKAVDLGKSIRKLPQDALDRIRSNPNQRGIQGLYSGGTLAAEAGMVLARSMGLSLDAKHPAGVMFAHGDHKVIDLGDDAYTQGKPHPMIDPTLRLELLRQAADAPNTAIILMDFVIGYGCSDDVAGVFAPAISRITEKLEREKRSIFFVASVTGTSGDPMPYEQQRKTLEDAGVYVLDSNARAVEFVLSVARQLEQPATEGNAARQRGSNWEKPRVINMGIKHFAPPIQENGGEAVQFQWSPPAGGKAALAALLDKLYAI